MPLDEIMVVPFVAQTVLSLLLCLLLLAFLRHVDQAFLRHWALSIGGLAGYAFASALALHLAAGQALSPFTAQILSGSALVAMALHLVWLIIGTWEAVHNASIRRLPHALLLGGATLLALGGLFTLGLPGIFKHWPPSFAVSPRHILAGLLYVGTAGALYRSLRDSGMISAKLAPLAFSLFGLHQFWLAAVANWHPEVGLFIPTNLLIVGLGFPFQVLIGYSIIIWLLEIERRRGDKAMGSAERAQQRLIHLQMHDPVTGLPNRRHLQEQLASDVQNAHGKRLKVAVATIALQRFNLVTQALGWQQTDHLIRDLVARLRSGLPPQATLGRIGERDFLVILPGIAKPQKVAEQLAKLLRHCSRPVKIQQQEVFLNLSGGVCVAPDHGVDAVSLIKLAQQAQIAASDAGELVGIHQPSDRPHSADELFQMERELRHGVKEGQFVLHFQPLISIKMRRISGFEALLRWHHPERGILTPGSFMQEAVHLGVLDELEDQILSQALGQLAEWQQDLSLPSITVSINLSAHRFQQPDLPEKIRQMCKQFKVNPVDLHLEITESAAMDDFEAALTTIAALRDLGCKVCLDDFGTGYSSLGHLRRLEVDYVKLDRSFITNIERDERERDMTRAVVDLIHSLGMTVLAEGVENRQQLGHLIKCRIDVIQGFMLGKPQPAEVYRSALDETQLIFGPDTQPTPAGDD